MYRAFTNENKALTKSLYEFEKSSSRRMFAIFFTKRQKERTGHVIKKSMENRKHPPKASKRQTEDTDKNVTTADELVSLLNHEGQNKHTVQYARYLQRWV